MKVKRILIGLVTVFLLIVATGSLCPASAAYPPSASHEMQQALRYLHSVQNEDGGFPSTKGGQSSRAVTSWVIMGLSAAGEQVAGGAWAPAGRNPVDYLRENGQPLTETCEYARLLLALSAAGQGPQYQQMNLTECIAGFQQSSGQFAQPAIGEDGFINAHMWSILALYSAHATIPQPELARTWLLSQQNADGGFGWSQGISSDADDTGIAIQTLVLLGEKQDSKPLQKAVLYLKSCQQTDGGLSCGADWMGTESNAASDAWGVLGLMAAGEDLDRELWRVNGKTPVDHLISLQAGEGCFQWKSGVDSSNITMTAYALMVLAGRPFPANIDYENRTPAPAQPAPGGFSDFKPGEWAYEPVKQLVDEGVLSGYGDGSFKPGNPVSREEFAKIIVNGLGLQNMNAGTTSQFADVPADAWANPYIAICVSKGYVQGVDDVTFFPKGQISGAQLAAILVRALPDYDAAAVEQGPLWYSGYVAAALEYDLLYPGFQAESSATRAQCAYSIVQLQKQLKKPL